jgi:hypothetical protein
MIGTGFTFAIGVGGIMSIVGAIAMIRNKATIIDVLQTVGQFSVAAFVLGAGFAGVLALLARGKNFSKLSVPLVGAVGVGAGLIYFGLISINGIGVWTPRVALLNFSLLTVMGGASAVAMLLIARRASSKSDSELGAGEEHDALGAGEPDIFTRTRPRSESEYQHRRDS